jgi:hypothetical protein
MPKHVPFGLFLMVFSILVLALASVALDMDLAAGTWKQDSTHATAGCQTSSAPNTRILRIEAQKKDLKVVLDTVDAGGNPVRVEFAGKYDGKDYPVTGLPDADTVSLRQLDAYTVDCSYKKSGTVVKSERVVVSSDWKRATVFQKGPDPFKLDFTLVSVWNKQ